MGEIPSLGEKYCKVDSDQLLPSYEDHGAIDMKMSPTIGIITALPKEYAAVAALFKNSREYFTTEAGNNQRYTIGEVPAAQGGRHTVVLALLPVIGIGMAAARTALLLEQFPRVRDILMVGIAGGAPSPETPDEHVRLGDIVISNQYGVIQYDSIKRTMHEVIYRPLPRPPSSRLLSTVRYLEALEMKGERPWLIYVKQVAKKLKRFRPDERTDVLMSFTEPPTVILHPTDKKRKRGQPRVFVGPIASANMLLKDPALRDELRQKFGIKAVEMEGAGIADATWDQGAGYLVIRGICDYCDPSKGDVWQDYAAIVAAGYTRALLENIPSDERREEVSVSEKDETSHKARSFPTIWNVPSLNPYFTGREDILTCLHEALTSSKPTGLTQPHAIHGLGGIGKTQTAIHYAHLHCNDYQAVVWIRADSHEALIDDYFSLADLLNLPKQPEQNPKHMVMAVKRWFQTHDNWLLIYDNVEDLEMVSQFFPSGTTGHILLTTQQQSTGTIAQQIKLDNMSKEEGSLFLLRRAKTISLSMPADQVPRADLQMAQEISDILGGLPLALDQAGAYIEETKCGLTGYLELYQKRRTDLLERRGIVSSGHPDSVTTTFSLSFEKVKKSNNAAVALLQLCAFLDPDAIPVEIISKGASAFGPELQSIASDLFEQNKAIEKLLKYSLLYRDTNTNTLTIHRLLQAVIKDTMTQDAQRQWAESTVRAVDQAFPEVDYTSWSTCQRYFPHAQVCAALIDRWNLTLMEAVRLLSRIAMYVYQRGQYEESEQLSEKLLAVHERTFGTEDPDIIVIFNNIAGLYRARGRYDHAEQLYLLALRRCENVKDTIPLYLALTLNGLGVVYEKQGKYPEAERCHQQSLTIRLRELGTETLEVAQCLNDLALVYMKQGRPAIAEAQFLQSLAIREKLLGQDHRTVAESLNNIAVFYRTQGKYPQAEEYYLRAHHIKEQILGPDHPAMATSYNNLAVVYEAQGKNTEACSYYQKAIEICERKLGPDHPHTKSSQADYENLLKKINQVG